MSPARPVVAAGSLHYRAAVAELPASARLSDHASEGVVVVPEEGPWWTSLVEVQAAGALAVVVSNPKSVPLAAFEALEALAGFLGEEPVTVPVVVEGPRLRSDVVVNALDARAGSPASMVTVEGAASAGEMEATLRDGLRWAAVLAGGPLSYCGGGDGIFLLEAAGASGPVPVTVGVRQLTGDARDPLLRVMALGEVRTEVECGRAGASIRLKTTTGHGTTLAPLRYETSARLALRRALDACSSGERLTELDHLLEDHRLVSTLLDPHKQD